jgi:uncharacterized Zn finger protein
MKFILHSDSKDFLVCDSCGEVDFSLLPEKKLSADQTYKHFLFYECPNCAGAGFWTHGKTIDKKQQVGIALARCKALGTVKSNVARFYQQSC